MTAQTSSDNASRAVVADANPIDRDNSAGSGNSGGGDGNNGSSKAESTKRIAWFHPPKTGTSFGTTLVHYANSSLPPAVRMPICSTSSRNHCSTATGSFTRQYKYSVWFRDVFWQKEERHSDFGAHSSVSDDVWRAFGGHFFALWRSPAARAVSAFADRHDLSVRYPRTTDGLVQYARATRGWVTRMLAPNATAHSPQRASHEAAHRLSTGFAFVGLTDRFDVSICLFHLMFGMQPCLEVEHLNMRSTSSVDPNYASYKAEHIQLLKRLAPDPLDEALFERAEARFHEDRLRHGLTSDEPCRSLGCSTEHTRAFFAEVETGAANAAPSLITKTNSSRSPQIRHLWR